MHPFLKGFLVGLAAGAAAGLLLTPRKGMENRAWVRQRVQLAVETGQKAAQDQEERLRARFHESIAGTERSQPDRDLDRA